MPHTNSHSSAPASIKVAGSTHTFSRNKMLLVLLVPLFMTLMQVSSINTALSSIQISMDASDSEIQWVISAYSLIIGIFLVPSGRLGDIFGRSAAFITGLSLFSLASLLIGFSTNALVMNLLRVMQGAGAGILSPQTTGLIQEYFQGKDRARAFSLFGLVIATSVAAGPVMSGGLIALLGPEVGWRFSFWINFPLGMLGVILGCFWLPFGKERRTIGKNAANAELEYEALQSASGQSFTRPVNMRSRVHDTAIQQESQSKHIAHTKVDLDPVGMILLAIAVLMVMIPFMITAHPLVHLISLLGLLLLIGWIFWEKHYKERGRFPMVDLDLFRIETYRYSMAVIAIHFLGMTSVWAIFSIFLQNALGVTALEVGLISLPNACLSAVASVLTGRYSLEHGRAIQVLALSTYTVGVLGCIGITWLIAFYEISFWWYIIPTLLIGLGAGAIGAANQTTAMRDVPVKSGGTAGGVMQTGQRMTTAIGIALITAIFYAVRGPVDAPTSAPADAHWFAAVTAAFAAVASIVTIANIVAIIFWRQGKRELKVR